MPLPLKNVIDNLEEFALILMVSLTDERVSGRDRLIGILEEAKSKYLKSSYTQARVQNVDNALDSLRRNLTLTNRIEVFLELVNSGGWKNTSFNCHLFYTLVRSVPGYNHEVTLSLDNLGSLKELTVKEIVKELERIKKEQTLIEQRATIQRKEVQIISDQIKNVSLFYSLFEATQFAKANPAHTVFLQENESKVLFWISPTGKSYRLIEVAQFNSILENKTALDQLKIKAQSALNDFLAKVKLVINPENFVLPKDNELETYASSRFSSTFVLVHTAANMKLYWFSLLSRCKEINVSDYPELSLFLSTFDAKDEEQVTQLKSQLMEVDLTLVNKTTDDQEFMGQLSTFFAKQAKAIQEANETRLAATH